MNLSTEKKNSTDTEIIYKAKRHWSYGLPIKTFGAIAILAIPSMINDNVSPVGSLIVILPAVITILRHKNFGLYITKDRIVLEEGAFTRETRYIPLAKVNDIIVKKSPFFSSGNISILTGNEKAKPIKAVKDPEAFRDKLHEAINSLDKKDGVIV